MGQRSRKRRTAKPKQPAGNAGGPFAPRRTDLPRATRPERSEAQNEAVRAELEPLAPGERPFPLIAAAVLMSLSALGNVVLWIVGWEISGDDPSLAARLIPTALLVLAAVGTWMKRYWALLGVQALLGLTIISAFLALTRAGNWQGLLLTLVTIAVCSYLFVKLIRIMARVQMPPRPGH